jgi:ParB family chromosome partitioning protein
LSRVAELEVKKLFLGKCNVRKDLGDISELVESIKQVGVLEPLIVRPTLQDKFEVVVGNRRYHAAKKAGIQKVPCIVREMDDEEAMITSLTENIQRGDISEEEIAMTYRALHEMNPRVWTQATFAKRLGKSQQWISGLLTAYQTLVKLEGIAKGMKAYPKEEERKRGIASVEHLKEIEYALRSEEVKKTLSEEEIEEKRKELAEETLDLSVEDAKAVYDRFKMYPWKPVEQLKSEALAKKTGVALKAYLPPKVARNLDELAEKRRAPVEEILPEVLERGLRAEVEPTESEREVPAKMVSEIDVGEVECPKCGTVLHLIHCEPGKTHKVESKTP